MNTNMLPFWAQRAAVLAIQLLFLMVWGFAGIDKLRTGVPGWFPAKFGGTLLGTFPGVTATFWLLAASEMIGFLLAAVALLSGECLRRKRCVLTIGTVVWSLFIFLELNLGNQLTKDFNATGTMFAYFAGTLLALNFLAGMPAGSQQTAGSR